MAHATPTLTTDARRAFIHGLGRFDLIEVMFWLMVNFPAILDGAAAYMRSRVAVPVVALAVEDGTRRTTPAAPTGDHAAPDAAVCPSWCTSDYPGHATHEHAAHVDLEYGDGDVTTILLHAAGSAPTVLLGAFESGTADVHTEVELTLDETEALARHLLGLVATARTAAGR